MKLIYKQNPLDTEIRLSREELEILRLRVQNEHLFNYITFPWHETESEFKDQEEKDNFFKRSLQDFKVIRDWLYKEGDFVEGSNFTTEDLIKYLGTSHEGDCTNVPASCIRCHLETHLGINTLDHVGNRYHRSIFRRVYSTWNIETQAHDIPEKTIDAAIAAIEERNQYITKERYPEHHELFLNRNIEAAKVLREYKEFLGPDLVKVVETPIKFCEIIKDEDLTDE
jgi:hypothetical protein